VVEDLVDFEVISEGLDDFEAVNEALISEILTLVTSWVVFLVVDLADDEEEKPHRGEKISK